MPTAPPGNPQDKLPDDARQRWRSQEDEPPPEIFLPQLEGQDAQWPGLGRSWIRQNSLLGLTSGMIVVSAFVASLLLMVQRDQTLEDGKRLTNALATVVDEQTSRTIQTVDQRLLLVAQALTTLQEDSRLDQQSARAMLRQQIESLPYVHSVRTLDAQGRVEYDSDEGNIGVDLSGRDYFNVYRTRPGTGLYLGDAVRSRSSGAWLVDAARPLVTQGGQFAGVVVAALEPPYFDRLWQSLALESGSAVSLMRADGTMLLRSPLDDSAMGRSFAGGPLFTQHLAASATGGFQVNSPIDGSPRFISYRALTSRPDLVVVIGRSIQAILGPWRALAWLVLVIWAVVSLAATALAIYLSRLSGLRRRAEHERAIMTRRLTHACEAAGIVVWDWDLRTDRWYATATYYTTLGYPPRSGPVDQAQWFDLLHPDDRAMAERLINRLRNNTAPSYSHEVRLRHADGSYRWTQVTGQVNQRSSDGTPLRMIGVRMDVTERRNAEVSLRESEEKYRMLIDRSPYAIAVHQDGLLVMVNPAMVDLVGATGAGVLNGQPVMHLIHPDNRAAANDHFTRMLAGETGLYPTQDRYVRLDGTNIDVQVTAAPFVFQHRPAVQVVILDVTDRKQAECALLESEERFRSAFDSSGIGMALTALDGQWLRVNQALCDIVGYSADELLQRTFMDVTHPDDMPADLAHMDDLFCARASSFQMEKRYLHRHGHVVWINLTVALVRDAQGAPLHTVAQMEDVSGRKKLEIELRSSQASLSATLDALPDLMFEIDLRGRYLNYHSPRTDLLVRSPNELIGRQVADVLPHAAATSIMAGLQETLATGHSDGKQIELELPDGTHWFELTMALKAVLPAEEPRFIVLSRDVTPRWQALEALRTSEERFRQMAETVREAFWLCDLAQDRMLYVSPAYETVTGYSVASLLADPTSWRAALHPDDRERVLALLDRDRAKGDYDLEYRILLPDGQVRWIHGRAFPIPDEYGNTYRAAGIMDDITARKTLQLQGEVEREVLEFVTGDRSLPEVLEHFVLGLETLLPGSRGSVLLMDADGVHIRHGAAPHLPTAYCDAIGGIAIGPNAGSCGTAAYTGEAVLVADIWSDPRWQDYLELAQSHDLRACWSVPIKGSQGAVLGTFAFYFNAARVASVTEQARMERGAQLASQAIERHRAAAALQQSEERYRSLVEWSPLGIAVHQDGVLVFVNPACVAILGAQSERDLLGRRMLDFIPHDEHEDVRPRIARILAGEATTMVLRKYCKLDGSVILVEGKGAPITINGAPAVQITMRDVTAEKAAQSALLENRQQLRVLSARVLATQETERRRVAHELHDELGQALTAIKINLQAQGRYQPDPPGDLQTENIRIVEQTLQQVRGLALALRPSMLDDLGLLPALRWLVEQTATRHGIDVQLHAIGLERLSSELETAVFRIVQEALTNIVRHAGASHVDVIMRNENGAPVVVVRDDGTGFDVAAMQQRATQGHSMGVLGMAERAALVDATLAIESTPGHGSTVTLRCRLGGPTAD